MFDLNELRLQLLLETHDGQNSKLTIDGKEIDLPIYEATNGPDVVDVGKLTGQGISPMTQASSTAACDSEITFIDVIKEYCF